MPAVSNSSPLICFAKIDRLDVLRQVFGEVFIPLAVYREVSLAGPERPGADRVANSPWIKVKPVADEERLQILYRRADPGEAEAIALALELGAATPTILDDLRGRTLARRFGVRVFGSGSVLRLAKNLGILPSVRPLLDELRAAGLYLSPAIYQELLAQAGEWP